MQAQSNKEKTTAFSTAKPSASIAELCGSIDMVTAAIKNDPSLKVQDIGDVVDKKVEKLDKKQVLTDADKTALKKSMGNLIQVMVETQLLQSPDMKSAMKKMSEEKKKETINMALKIAKEEINSGIDDCKTIEDFIGITNN